MQTVVTSLWQKRRSKFSHDWLKNQFTPALAKFLNLLDDKIEDAKFERSFVALVLPEWESYREEASALALDFHEEMSPKRLFHQLPLSRCDEHTREWLGDLAHNLWLVRYSVDQWGSDASAQAANTDLSYVRLREAMQNCTDVKSAPALRQFRHYFVEFRKCCLDLAVAMEKLPGEMRVT